MIDFEYCIQKAIEWLKENIRNDGIGLEADWIVSKQLYKEQFTKSTAYSKRIDYIKKNTFSNCIPNKYGGSCGSVIYTSEAARIFRNTEMGARYLEWVKDQQFDNGSWEEAITQFLPKNKTWYHHNTKHYWITATVILNIFGERDKCESNILKGYKFLLKKIDAIIMYSKNIDKKFLISYMIYQNIDIWSLAHLLRVLYLQVDKYTNEIQEIKNILLNIHDEDEIWSNNLDATQNVCSVLLDYASYECKTKIDNLIIVLLKRQHITGGWGYNERFDDITLTAYITALLVKYFGYQNE